MIEEKHDWDQVWKLSGAWYPNEFLVRFVSKYLKKRIGYKKWVEADPTCQRVLDVGCGTGRHVALFAEYGFDVAGIDLSYKAVEWARRRIADQHLEADLRVGSATELPWETSSFDVIVSCGVLDHMCPEETEKAVAEIARVIRPGGMLYVDLCSKNEYSFGKGKKVAENAYLIESGEEAGLVQHFFDEESIRKLLEGRFNLVDIVYATSTPIIGSGFCSWDIREKVALARYHITARKESTNTKR